MRPQRLRYSDKRVILQRSISRSRSRSRSREKNKNPQVVEDDTLYFQAAKKLQQKKIQLKRLQQIEKNKNSIIPEDEKDLPKLQFILDLLPEESKLFGTLNCRIPQKKTQNKNQQYRLNGQYIPGDYIHKQFAAYYRHFIRQYYAQNKYEVINNKKIDPSHIQNLQQFINFLKQFRQYETLNKKFLQILKNMKEYNDSLSNAVSINKNIHKFFEQIQKDVQNHRYINNKTIRQQFNKKYKQIKKIEDHIIISGQKFYDERFKQIQEMQMKFRQLQNNLSQLQDPASQTALVKAKQQLYQWHIKQPDILNVYRSGGYLPSTAPNFAMGRLSFVSNNKLYVFQPFQNKNKEIKSHPQLQIMESARQTIQKIKLYKNEDQENIYSKFQKSDIILLDIFSERSNCGDCKKEIPVLKVQSIQLKILEEHQQIFVRVSYHKPYFQDFQKKRFSDKLSQKGNKNQGEYIQDFFLLPEKKEFIDFARCCFTPINVFCSKHSSSYNRYIQNEYLTDQYIKKRRSNIKQIRNSITMLQNQIKYQKTLDSKTQEKPRNQD